MEIHIIIGPYYKPANAREKPTLCYEVCTKGFAGLGILGPYIKNSQSKNAKSRMEVNHNYRTRVIIIQS